MNKSILWFGVFLVSLTGCRNGTVYAHTPLESPSIYYVRAIIGEAEDQGYEGMLAVACAIQNRPEKLQGVRGFHRLPFHPVPREIEIDARLAYFESLNPENCSFLRGADMWENIDAFGYPDDWPAVKFISKIGDHYFYRRITNK